MHIQLRDRTITVRRHKFSALSLYSYTVDWIIYISILVTFMIYGSIVPPRFHEFSLSDISLMHTYKTEPETAIPIFPLISISVGLPILQFFICSMFSRRTLVKFRIFWDVFVGLMSLCGGMATQLMITCILKNICGLPRPDMISRCEPSATAPRVGLTTVEICTNVNFQHVEEGFRSFPSGHSSTVFCGMVISSLNIAGKMQVFDNRGISFKVLLAIIPLMIACFVSCTRISDNRHFLRDVIGGSFIGINVGVWFYHQYFPSVFNLENCGRAYPPRRIGIAKFFNNVGGFWKIEDNLPGAFNQRYLNSAQILPAVNELYHQDSNEQDISEVAPGSFEEISNNIEFFNKLNKSLQNQYLNLSKARNESLPMYNSQSIESNEEST